MAGNCGNGSVYALLSGMRLLVTNPLAKPTMSVEDKHKVVCNLVLRISLIPLFARRNRDFFRAFGAEPAR